MNAHGLVKTLLERLPFPERLYAPEILIESDGSLAFDWDRSRYASVSVSLEEDGNCGWAALIGDWKAHGRFTLPAQSQEFIDAMIRLGEFQD